MERIVDERVHKHEQKVFKEEEIPYVDSKCRYCGSITPEEALKMIKSSLTIVVVADQKYGFPHKLYLDGIEGLKKFYTRHLLDTNERTFFKLTDLIAKKTNIRFEIMDNSLRWYVLGAPVTLKAHE